MIPFLSPFSEDILVELKEMGTGKVHQVLHAGSALVLYCPKGEHMYYMLLHVFVDGKLSIW